MHLYYRDCTKRELDTFGYAKADGKAQWPEHKDTSQVKFNPHVEAVDASKVFQLAKLAPELRQQIYENPLTFQPGTGHCYPQILRTSQWVYGEARDIIAKANEVEIAICSTAWPSSFLVPYWPGIWQLAPPPGVPGISPTYDEATLTVCISIQGTLVYHHNVTNMHVLQMWDMWPIWVRRAEKLIISVDRREGVPGFMYHGASPHDFVEQLLLSLGAVAKACKRLQFRHAGTGEYYMGRIYASVLATSAFPGVEKVLNPPLEAPTERSANQINIASRVFGIIEVILQILTAASLLCKCGVFYSMWVSEVSSLPGLLQSLTLNEKLRAARPRWLQGLNPPAVDRARRTYVKLLNLLWLPEWYRPEVSSEIGRSLEELSKFVDDVAEYYGSSAGGL
ncbi:hypothetical protein B0A48_03375 [Cryoendolithus antarcticus]|uniref:Uncharacterized protein n=1 Tax=Cryoendolithus antarcticus TaxID=1507870 RepID=A0A1V8TK81_9PEZI|nr:hypothetical protein B0A48_03375 [Cryoendolithus antarcticus]